MHTCVENKQTRSAGSWGLVFHLTLMYSSVYLWTSKARKLVSVELQLYLFFSDHTRCNVWILDGDLYHKGLLKFAVSAESLQDTLVVFVADMSRPWTVMESLQKWASVLQEHIDKMKIPPEDIRDMEQKCKFLCIHIFWSLFFVCCFELTLAAVCCNDTFLQSGVLRMGWIRITLKL